MGNRIIALAAAQPEKFRLVAAIERADSPWAGKDVGSLVGLSPTGVAITAKLPEASQNTADVLIDFSAPAATRELIAVCRQQHIGMVVGTTGLAESDQLLINEAARDIPILQAANTSLGVNLLLNIAAEVARKLGDAYDIEIVESHHNQKKDAPSGTALALAESICTATNRNLSASLEHGRHGGDAKRRPGTIGMHALRMGDVVGEHTVYFAAGGERIEIRHVATTRDTFAMGALRAAAFIAGSKPGRYSMADVLGIS